MLSCIALIEDNIAVNSCAILVSQQQVKCKSSIVSYSLPRGSSGERVYNLVRSDLITPGHCPVV